jgi:dUTP pyrophosphatase
MEVKIKKLHADAVIPSYSTYGDAAMDLTAVSLTIDKYDNLVYYTGLSMEIPYGYVGLIFPRSSVSKLELSLANSVGVIDSGYRGEIMCKFKRLANDLSQISGYVSGDRVAQIMIIPKPEISFVEVDELSDSVRGEGGFGSTGK